MAVGVALGVPAGDVGRGEGVAVAGGVAVRVGAGEVVGVGVGVGVSVAVTDRVGVAVGSAGGVGGQNGQMGVGVCAATAPVSPTARTAASRHTQSAIPLGVVWPAAGAIGVGRAARNAPRVLCMIGVAPVGVCASHMRLW